MKREKFFSNKSRKKWLSKREKWIQSILYGTGVTVLIQPLKCFWLLSVSWRVVDLYWNFLLIWLELCVFYGTRKNINLRYGIFSWVSLYKFKCAFYIDVFNAVFEESVLYDKNVQYISKLRKALYLTNVRTKIPNSPTYRLIMGLHFRIHPFSQAHCQFNLVKECRCGPHTVWWFYFCD